MRAVDVMAELDELTQHAPARNSFGAVRNSEWVIFAFLVYAIAAASLLPIPADIGRRLVLINLAVIPSYALLIWLDSTKPGLALSIARDWLPLALTELGYQEMGWFHTIHRGHLESVWVIWDRAFLRGGGKAAIEAFGPVLPAILEIAYSLTYALAPLSVVLLYLFHQRSRVDRFQFIFVLGVLLCCAQFPFWPSEPPRLLYFGEDFPSYNLVFRRFNWWVLASWAIHNSVFPSAHVAGAFSAAFGMRRAIRAPKWAARFLFVMAGLIALATIYGRYHYIADAAAGFAMAAVALAVGILLTPRDEPLPRRL